MYIGLWIQIEEGEIAEDVSGAPRDANKEESIVEASPREAPANHNERKPSNWLRRDGYQRPSKMVNMDGNLLGGHIFFLLVLVLFIKIMVCFCTLETLIFICFE